MDSGFKSPHSESEALDSTLESSGFEAQIPGFWRGSTGFEAGKHWIPISKPLDSRSETEHLGAGLNAPRSNLRDPVDKIEFPMDNDAASAVDHKDSVAG